MAKLAGKGAKRQHVGKAAGSFTTLPAPFFRAMRLSGEPVTLDEYAGRYVAILFVVPCQPCAEVLPHWAAMAPWAARDGVELVIVSGADAEDTRSFLAAFESQLPVLIAPAETNPFSRDYRIEGWPAYAVVDERGRIVSSGYPRVATRDWEDIADEWHVPRPS